MDVVYPRNATPGRGRALVVFLRRRAGTFGFLALVVQWAAWFVLSSNWSEARNLGQVGCSVDGACTEDGWLGLLLSGSAVIPLAELGAGVVLLRLTARHDRHDEDPRWVHPRPLAWSFVVGAAATVVAAVVSGSVVGFTERTTTTQARQAVRSIAWCCAVVVLVLAVLAVTVTVRERRKLGSRVASDHT